jgi:hypothetical protein
MRPDASLDGVLVTLVRLRTARHLAIRETWDLERGGVGAQ